MIDKKKLKMHLQAALDCLEGEGEEEGVEDSSPEESDDEGDLPMKSMKMSLSKYKV